MNKLIKNIYQIIYNLMYILLFPIWIGLNIINFHQKRRLIKERLSIFKLKIKNKLPIIWYHGSSLGEILTLKLITEALKKEFSHIQIISANTSRGIYIADKLKLGDKRIYLPLDISFIIRRALKKIKPTCIIILETEIWPNLFWESQKNNIPIIIVSGRISERSYPKYRLAKFFFKTVLEKTYCLMQTNKDKEKIINIGANHNLVKVTGDIKFDKINIKLSENDKKELNLIFNKNNNKEKKLIIGGSTHEGEEKIIIQIYKKLERENKNIHLLIAPRHLKRLTEIENLLKKEKLPYILRSKIKNKGNKNKIILLDTYGELAKIYWLGDIIFIGGTLVPIGGHNLLEPLIFGKPVIFGPYISNCYHQAQIIIKEKCGFKVNNSQELEKIIKLVLNNNTLREEIKNRALKLINKNIGSLKISIKEIKKILKKENII